MYPASNRLTGYLNSASAVGTGANSLTTTDISNDGSSYQDGAGDFNPNETDDNTPTQVDFTESGAWGATKEVMGVVNNNDGSFNIKYKIKAKNFGDVVLSNIKLEDNLELVFSGVLSYKILSFDASSTLSADSALVNTSPLGTVNLLASGNSLNVNAEKTLTPYGASGSSCWSCRRV